MAVAALVAVAFTVTGPVGLTQAAPTQTSPTRTSQDASRSADQRATKVFTLDPSPPVAPFNNPEGVAWDKRTRSFFVGIVGTGVIYRGTLGNPTVAPFITPDGGPGEDGAVGMKVAGGKLYVAGGPTGSIYVYSIRTGAELARFETGSGGFLNDLVVTPRGDVYVTDSFRPTLWHLTPAMVKARSGTPEAISVGPEINYIAGEFNLNGIVSRRGGRELIVVQSAAQSFFRILINPKNTAARKITRIDAPALGGDGLLIDRGRLLVVVGTPAAVHVLRLSNRDLKAREVKVLTDPTLRGPSTIARARNRYLVVNADFATSRQPFTVSGLPRGHR
jgi:Cu-Zn family superoxide dismutase